MTTPPVKSLRTIAIAKRPGTSAAAQAIPAPVWRHPAPDQLANVLPGLATAIEHLTDPFYSEADLEAFVRWAIKYSYSKRYSDVERLQLLDVAWCAQKLLWSLRKGR